MVHNFIEGNNACVIMFGPSDCGKTFAFKGNQGSERGIAPRAVEEILGLIKNRDIQDKELNNTPNFSSPQIGQKVFLKMSIYMVLKDEIVDLLNRSRKTQYPDDEDKNEKPIVEHYLD